MLARTIGIDVAVQTPLRIGDWRVDPNANELERAQETVRVEPKVMQVLTVLAGRPGGVVSRDELLAAVWPDVVVGEEALTQAIIKLRRALGDNPRAPSYIETISKRGYRLIAPVSGHEVGAASGELPPPAPAPSRHPFFVPALFVAIALALLSAVYAYHAMFRPALVPQTAATDVNREADGLSVTVTPFEPIGAAADQAYLARGISDNLMTDLARLPGLRVIRASALASATHKAPAARYVVSGSVQRDAETLRVNVHLLDTATHQHLWSERFERPFGDLFTVQDDITRRLTEQLPLKLAEATKRQLSKRYTRSLAAYDNFLRGQSLFLVRRAAENEQARAFYRKAIDLDPSFARAYAGLAMTYAIDTRLQPSRDASQPLARAMELAETARQIDPDIPEVHWAIGFVHVQSRRHDDAIRSLQRAIELNRSFADAYALMGGIHTYIGQPAQSIPLLRTAMRLEPDGGYLYYLLLGRAYLFLNDVEQALINLREASARNPVDLETRIYLAAALAAAGETSQARWEAGEIQTLERDFSMRRWIEQYPLTDTKERERLIDLVAQAGL